MGALQKAFRKAAAAAATSEPAPAPSRDAWLTWLERAINDPDGKDAAGAELLDWLKTKDEMSAAVSEMLAAARRAGYREEGGKA